MAQPAFHFSILFSFLFFNFYFASLDQLNSWGLGVMFEGPNFKIIYLSLHKDLRVFFPSHQVEGVYQLIMWWFK